MTARPEVIVAPGVFDGITARLVEQAGFPWAYMTGAGTALSLGFPDYGLLTLTEMAAKAAIIARTAGIPVVADADTGYGNERTERFRRMGGDEWDALRTRFRDQPPRRYDAA